MPIKKFIPGRILELDLLRGFFIFSIILDHAQHLPDIHMYVTGQGKLWVSAAEGFFLISGLLTGYIRGFRQKDRPMKEQTFKLFRRGVLLYVTAIVVTFLAVALIGLLPLNPAHVAKLPSPEQTSSLWVYVYNVLTSRFVFDWVYFLRLYGIIMIIAPLFIWAARKGKLAWFMLGSLGLYAASFLMPEPEGSFQWQFVFFAAASAGYLLPDIINWLNARPKLKMKLAYAAAGFTVVTFIVSYFFVLAWPGGAFRVHYDAIHDVTEQIFSNNPLMPARVALSFVWFSGMISIFHLLKKPINKYLGWMFRQFGNYSLSVYCLQAIVLIFFNWLVPFYENFFYNLVVNFGLLMIIWLIMRTKVARKILPR